MLYFYVFLIKIQKRDFLGLLRVSSAMHSNRHRRVSPSRCGIISTSQEAQLSLRNRASHSGTIY